VVQDFLLNLPGGQVGFLFFTMLVIFLLGFFIDFIEITFVVVPIVAPVLLAMGLDAEGRKADAINLLQTMESELPPASEPLLDWQADILRAVLNNETQALAHLADRLHQSGHRVLALQTRLLAGQQGANEAREELLRLGVAPQTPLPVHF